MYVYVYVQNVDLKDTCQIIDGVYTGTVVGSLPLFILCTHC